MGCGVYTGDVYCKLPMQVCVFRCVVHANAMCNLSSGQQLYLAYLFSSYVVFTIFAAIVFYTTVSNTSLFNTSVMLCLVWAIWLPLRHGMW